MAAPGQGMHNLTTLIKRLEAATSRLEDIASSTASLEPADGGLRSPAGGAPASSSAPELNAMSRAPEPPAKPAAAPLPPAISDLDEALDKDLETFIEFSNKLGGPVAEQARAVKQAAADQRQFLLVSTKAKKPDMASPAFSELIKDLQQRMTEVTDIKDNNRDLTFKDHLSMVGEGVSSLQWLVMDGKPADFVGEILGGAQLFGNRILKAYKEKDQTHVTYVQSHYALLRSLQAFIKQHYAAGVTWNAKGVDAAEALKEVKSAPTTNGVSAPSAPPGGGPPPPPPPPLPKFDNPPPPPPPQPAQKAAIGGDMGAVFDQLNRGESVTSGLKKVDKSQMTHKNPSLRAGAVVPDDSINRSRSRGPETKPKPTALRQNSTAKKEGKKELDGNKWFIENFEDPSAPIEVEVSLTQSVLISRCKNTTIILKGKANAISIDNSQRTSLVIDSLVSSVDVIKCPNFALQVLGTLPTVLLDQVDGAAIYLSKDSMNTEIFTSKCSSININMPPVKEEGDYKECPLPEQIRTYIKDGQLVSEIVEHAG